MNTKPELPSLESILAAFSAAGVVTSVDVQQLAESNQNLEKNPKFLADLQKASIANALRTALEKRNETQSAFAKRWQKTRQYVSRIFNLESNTNFTIDTITEAALLLDMRVTVKLHRPDQQVVISRASRRNAYRKPDPAFKAISGSGNHSHVASAANELATLSA